MKREAAADKKERRTMHGIPVRWYLLALSLCLASPPNAAAEEGIFLGANAMVKDTNQGSKGRDGAYHQYVVYGKGDNGEWGSKGSTVNISYSGPAIYGLPGYAGIYGESAGGQGGRGGGTSGFYSIGGNGGWGGLVI